MPISKKSTAKVPRMSILILAFTFLLVIMSSGSVLRVKGFHVTQHFVRKSVSSSNQEICILQRSFSTRKPSWRRRSTSLESSSSQLEAVKGKNKKAAWSRGVPMSERSVARVKVDTVNVAKNTRSYEKARPKFQSTRKNMWYKNKPVAGESMPSPTAIYLESLAVGADENSNRDKIAQEKRHPLFKFSGDTLKNESFVAPSLIEVYNADNSAQSYCSKLEYEEYYKVLTEILTKGLKSAKLKSGKLSHEEIEGVAQWLYRCDPLVETKLPLLESNSLTQDLCDKEATELLHYDLQEQKARFLENVSLNQVQYELINYVLVIFGHYCSKFRNSDAIKLAWYKVKEAGLTLNEMNCNTYLHILTSIPSSNGTSPIAGSILAELLGETGGSDSNAKPDLPCEVATFHDLMYKPTDRSTKLRVSALVAAGDPIAAEAVLNKFSPSGNSVKLRTYLPILKSYCDSNLCDRAFRLFVKMLNSPQAHLEAENYVLILATLAENGYFRSNSKALDLESVDNHGFTAVSGVKLFDEITSHMADDVLDITSVSAKRLYNAFVKSSSDLMQTGAVEIEPMSMLQTNNNSANDHELIVSRSTVDATSAHCLRSNVTLRLLKLDQPQKERLHQGLLEVAKEAFMDFNKARKVTKKDSQRAADCLQQFSEWMNTREGKPFTAVIDGANTAYFGQNFHEGRFNFYQIEFLVKALESMNEHALVVMPSKYTEKTFHVNLGGWRQQTATKQEAAVLQRLKRQGQLYVVPSGLLDDYYWMLASISSQEKSSNGKSLDVTPEQAELENRFPGTRPMVLSNDLMRDHRLELFDPRLFRRWTASHIVNYNFTAFVNDECVDPEVGFSTPDFFSHEIQANPSTNGDTTWHIPVSDWTKNERLVIRLPSDTS